MSDETPIEQPKSVPEVESVKSKRGGKRPGAGRKPNLAKRLLKGVHRDTITAAVEDINVGAVIQGLLSQRRLTGGTSGGVHITDVTNASGTQLLNLIQ